MKSNQILILSKDSTFEHFIKNSKKYQDFFSGLYMLTKETEEEFEPYFAVIVDKSKIEEYEIEKLAKRKKVILCLEYTKESIAYAADMNAYDVIYRPFVEEQVYMVCRNLVAASEERTGINKDKIDYLTNLPNRRGLYDQYEQLSKKVPTMHFMFLDIDNFKKVNDTYGHKMGDQLLIETSKVMQKKMGEALVSRVGGDEFVIMISTPMTRKQVLEKAVELLQSIPEIDINADVKSIITFSIGIILDQETSGNLDESVFMKCDAAMYRAKKTSKNAYVVYNDIEEELSYKKSVEREMQDALKNGEFEIYLHPVVEMMTSTVLGAEALVRWNHPKDGIREPEEFLSLLEENGFIVNLDMYVFEEACRVKESWKGKQYEHNFISVNMSRLHFYEEHYVENLLDIVHKYELEPSEIQIEITEMISMQAQSEICHTVQKLKDAGFYTAIDDFGSGYTALSVLREVPVDAVKIDRNVLKISNQDEKSKTIVRNIISMVRELKIDVIAEGVETQVQYSFLISCGCEMAQGFYYAMPMPIEVYEEFIQTHTKTEEMKTVFDFNDTLLDTTGTVEGKFLLGTPEYGEGFFDGDRAVHFTGGAPLNNVIEIPTHIMSSRSYTMSIWLKEEREIDWTSVIYAKYANGFASVIPCAWLGDTMFRIKDDYDDEGWYDAYKKCIKPGEWVNITATYNIKSKISRLYINGKLFAYRENAYSLKNLERLIIGGDIFQDSFEGWVSNVTFFNVAKSSQEIETLQKYCESKPGYKGRKNEDWL